MMNLNETLQQAISYHHQGKLPEAEELYRSILQADPGHPDVNYNLGLMALQLGKAELGLPHLQAAWEADPSVGQYWLSLAECLLEMGHSKDALLLIKDAIKRGIKSPQAQQLLVRAKSGNNKAQPSPVVVREVLALFNQAHYKELEERVKTLVGLYPRWALGWNALGLAMQEQGKDGIEAMRRAVGLAPSDAEAHNNLGFLLQSRGELDAALASLHRAVKIKPDYADAHYNLGVTLQAQGQLDAALASYHRALKIKPGLADAYNNLGVMLRAQGRLDAALANLRMALEIKPDYADAHFNSGLILHAQGQSDAALNSLRMALEIRPDYVEAHNNLGTVLKDSGQLDAALASYRRALEIRPDYVEAHNNLGVLLMDMGRFDAALASYRRALEIKPDYVEAHNNLGVLLRGQGKLDEALESCRRALEVEPDYARAHSNLGSVLKDMGEIDEALASYRRALEITPDHSGCYSNLLFCLSHNENVGTEALFAEHCRFGEQYEAPLRAGWPQHTNLRDPERCLRVGFVSGDLRKHAVSNFIEPALAHLAGYPQLSLHAYSNHIIEDSVTRRLRGYFAHWHAIAGLSDAALAEKIRADGIDILIDLSSHTAHNRLLTFARKPAPVQVCWLGYPGTTGLSAMDYFLTDRFFLPPGQFDGQFTEKIVQLPVSAPFLPVEDALPVNALPALSNGYVTFGSFNRLSKLSPAVIALWSQLLRVLPDSRMVLGGMPEDGKYDVLIEWFAREGIARERLSFYPRCGMNSYLGLHQQVDICLDTFPYNGGTTTCHALWMGVPTLTLAGHTIPGRPGAGLLGHVGLEAFAAQDAADFVRKGVNWAGNLATLSDIRAGLRERFAKSAMGQPAMVAAGVERALHIMWQRWCAGLLAEPFEVRLTDLSNTMR